jgi:hypothetical protein
MTPHCARREAAVIILATFIAYLPALRASFVFDDAILLLEQPFLRAADGLRLPNSAPAQSSYASRTCRPATARVGHSLMPPTGNRWRIGALPRPIAMRGMDKQNGFAKGSTNQ